MRILNYNDLKKEMEGNAAFNVALLRAIDPRLITHRPRDPDKARLMAELGLDITIPEDEGKAVAYKVRTETGKPKRQG